MKRYIRNPTTGAIANWAADERKYHITPVAWELASALTPNGYGETARDVNQQQWDDIPDGLVGVDLGPILTAIAALKIPTGAAVDLGPLLQAVATVQAGVDGARPVLDAIAAKIAKDLA